jgi:FMN phosphatase YigB (HAD superfamily)
MIKAVLFDAYGTLLDVDAAAAQLASSGKFPELQSCWPELAFYLAHPPVELYMAALP